MLLPELQDAITVTVKTSAALPGQPDKVYLKRKIDPDKQQVADTTVSWERAREDLARELKQRRKEGGEATNIKMECDADLRNEFVMEVYDVCKNSGFSKIHFVPPPLLRPPKE